MDYIVSATTDIGNTKRTNQDSYHVRVYRSNVGKIVFSVLCDGMGGFDHGEIASAYVVRSFFNWADARLATVLASDNPDSLLRSDWSRLIDHCNEAIAQFAARGRLVMGTTLTAMLITPQRYTIVNVGDTRAYVIAEELRQLTYDQTVVAHEVRQGILTPEEAKRDPRRNVLLQCIVSSEDVYPDFFFGGTRENVVYMMCTDGFRNELTEEELFTYLHPNQLVSQVVSAEQERALIATAKQRQERDNISVITIRTF